MERGSCTNINKQDGHESVEMENNFIFTDTARYENINHYKLVKLTNVSFLRNFWYGCFLLF